MSTADTDDSGLQALLLAVLRSGTPLANALRGELHKLSIWLHTQFPDEPDSRRLFDALLALRDGGGRTDRATAPVGDELDASPLIQAASPLKGQPDPAEADDQDAAVAAAAAVAATADEPIREQVELGPADVAAGGLRALWEQLRDDPIAGRYCPGYGQPADDQAEVAIEWLWTALFLVCLRLPREQAEDVRRRAQEAIVGYPEAARLAPLAPDGQPADGDDDPKLRELRQAAAADALQRWPGLAADVTWLAWLAWHDEGVQCAHDESNALGISPFGGDEPLRQLFTENFTDKLKELSSAAGADPDDEIRQLAKVDEALRGVVPIPLPQPGSWWAYCLERSKERLDSHGSADKVVKVLRLGLSNPDEWDTYFDTVHVVRIDGDKTADGAGVSGKRVWLLRYPILPAGSSPWTKGRYIAVR